MGQATPDKPVQDDNSWTSKRLLHWIHGHLEAQEVDSPRVCAELLVGHAIGSERLKLYMEPERVAQPDELATLRGLVARAARHEPVQYLVGNWPFFGREFEVEPCTLIPRPATETVVELALGEFAQRGARRDWRVLDLCTGSGCIAVSLAASMKSTQDGRVSERRSSATRMSVSPAGDVTPEIPTLDLEQQVVAPDVPSEMGMPDVVDAQESTASVHVVATDIVEDALMLVGRNAARHGVEELVDCRLGSLFDPLVEAECGSFDLICANPPYVTDDEYEKLDRNVRDYEPEVALRGGPDGLDLILPILEQAPRWLSKSGLLLMEIGDPIHERVYEQALRVPGLVDIRLERDHEAYQRVLIARSG